MIFVMKLWLRIPLVKSDEDYMGDNPDALVSQYAKVILERPYF